MREGRKWLQLLVACLLAGSLALAGCSGDDGDNGAQGLQGLQGEQGEQGEQGPVTTSDESCNVCHGAGAFADIAEIHTNDAPATVTIDAVDTTVTADGKVVTVDFTVMNGTKGVTGLALSAFNFYLADIVPAGTNTVVSGTWPTAYLERWAYERTGTYNQGTLVAGATAGEYTYTFKTPYSDPAFVAAPAATSHSGDPIGAETLADVAPERDIYTDTQRVVVKLGSDSTAHYGGAVGVQDFTVADNGVGVADTVTAVDPDRVLAPISGCKECHSDNMQQAAHASSYMDTRACNICHSPISAWPHSPNDTNTGDLNGGADNSYGSDITADGAWLTKFVHQLHSGNAWFDGPADEITYPENIKNCAKCHNGDDNMSDAWKTNPTGEACAACHSGNVINNDGTMTHDPAYASKGAPAGSYTDAVCSGCHPSSAVESAHAVTTLKNAPEVSITPNYTSQIDITAPANGQYYVAGEAPVVTVSASDASGAMSTADFTAAKMYVYGPRAKALPILTPGSTTDPAYDPATVPTQGVNMLDTTDANVTVNATDLQYQLQAIPDTLEAGTYMVMVYVTDPSSRNIPNSHGGYNIDGWQLTTIKIGTATDTPRVAGDGCNKCHDLTDWTSTAHRAYFGTDGCLACHDQSGGHADTIANRVHAVHAATEMGDLSDRDWTEVTYPSNLTNCEVCHNSGDTSYIAPEDNQPSQWAKPCIGCHGDTPGAKDHMIQNGGPLTAE